MVTEDSTRRAAHTAGVLFFLTFATSIPAVFLSGPVVDHPRYIIGMGTVSRLKWGAVLEVLLAIANVRTAVVLFPILKRANEAVALGYVACRIIESTIIVFGL